MQPKHERTRFYGIWLAELHESNQIETEYLKIKSIAPNSKAEKAGIRANDFLISLCGEFLTTFNEAGEILKKHDMFEPIEMEIMRKGEIIDVAIILERDEKLGVNF